MGPVRIAFRLWLRRTWNIEAGRRPERIQLRLKLLNSFKVFMAYKDVMILDDGEIIEVFFISINCSAYNSIYFMAPHFQKQKGSVT